MAGADHSAWFSMVHQVHPVVVIFCSAEQRFLLAPTGSYWGPRFMMNRSFLDVDSFGRRS